MQIDALAVRLRPRTPAEAADLGVRLCQAAAPQVYRCYLIVALPVMALSLATVEIAGWLPGLLIWWSKPWLDRTVLFVLSRAAFGQPTTASDLWRAQRNVWWSQLVFTFTIRRLSPWRSFTQPVYQLEGASPWGARARVRQIRHRQVAAATMMTQVFALAEFATTLAALSLVLWFAPAGSMPDVLELVTGEIPGVLAAANTVAYAATVLFIEPFYVAAGFAMYLNRRAELEAWDIEQEFRRVFAR
jgi:hypothetical protein